MVWDFPSYVDGVCVLLLYREEELISRFENGNNGKGLTNGCMGQIMEHTNK